MADPNTRQGKRTPVTLKIKFKSETLEQFIERYAVDVSQGGIFIRTKEPLAVGTQMKFEFQLRDASPLIAGEGTVVWTRENDPSRPAIAPGMGVRFDRLADGSQTVLEKILAEKAKQAPARSTADASGRQQMFTDTPTKVAPTPVQEALGLQSRSRTDSEQTPLPKPMPFHSDAEDFDEKAFDEATKVRSLDDLALASADLDADPLGDGPANATALMPADELLRVRRVTAEGRAISEPGDEPADKADKAAASRVPLKSVPDRDSAPGLPSPPAVDTAARAPRLLDREPAADAEPAAADDRSFADAPPERTKPGVEPARAVTAPPPAAAAEAATPRAVAAEPSRPMAPRRPSSAPIIIGILVAAAAAIGGVWWFVLREDVASKVADDKPKTGTPPDKGSANMAANQTGSGSADPAHGSGSADPAHGGGSATPPPPAAPPVDTVIASSGAKGATVEIVGTDQAGPAPFTAKLEKDKSYKARLTAPGFTTKEIDVKGGEPATAKLEPKPRVITVTSEPPGADIYVDSVNTKKVTPSDVELTASQAAKPRVRISLRRAGFRPVDQMIDAKVFKDEDSRMVHKVEAKLQQQVARPPGGGSAGGSGGGTGGGSGSGATGSGEDGGGGTTPAPGGGDASGSGGAGAGGGTGGGGGGTTPTSGGTPTPPAGGAATPSADTTGSATSPKPGTQVLK